MIHNMKLEIDTLKASNALLEEQVSFLKSKTEDISFEKNEVKTELLKIENEKSLMLQNLKQLEISSHGNSILPKENNINIDDVKRSFDRIRKSIDSKNILLEQRPLSIKTSKLLQSKVDEAKKLVENEKQKIINEKEEAVIEKLNMENQLQRLKNDYENHILQDRQTIKDLKAEILNKNLIIENINKSNEDLTLKLKEDLENIQKLYQNALYSIEENKEQIKNLLEENNKNKLLIETTDFALKQKIEETSYLRNELNILLNKNKNRQEEEFLFASQIFINTGTQTEEFLNVIKISSTDSDTYSMENLNIMKQQPVYKQLQVLTATTEPTYDFIRNSYLRYKMKNLSCGPLKQLSLNDKVDDVESDLNSNLTNEKSFYGNNRKNNYKTVNSPIKHNESGIENYDNIPLKNVVHNSYKSNSASFHRNNYESLIKSSHVLRSRSSERISNNNNNDFFVKPDLSNISHNNFVKQSTKIASKVHSSQSLPNISIEENVIEFQQTDKTTIPKTFFVTLNSKDSFFPPKLLDNNLKHSNSLSNLMKTENNLLNNEFSEMKNDLYVPYEKSNWAKRLNDSFNYNSSNKLFASKDTFSDTQLYKTIAKYTTKFANKGVIVKLDKTHEEYENKILELSEALKVLKKESDNKLDSIKVQYDNNIKLLMNKHDQGVQSLQNLHEETLRDIIRVHDIEVESLRTLSIDAMKKVEKYSKDNKNLKHKLQENNFKIKKVSIKIIYNVVFFIFLNNMNSKLTCKV